MTSVTLVSKDCYSRFPYWIRRRLRRSQASLVPVLMVGAAGVALLLLQVVLLVMLLRQQTAGDEVVLAADDDDGEMEARVAQEHQKGVGRHSGKLLSTKVIGAREEDLGKYARGRGDVFVCFPSGKKIPFDQMNDDYCDCPEDGSDEPSTGACPDGGRFYCATKEAKSQEVKSIPVGFVNDGFCDCCDGSDEWKDSIADSFAHLDRADQDRLGRHQVPCPDTC